MARRGVTIRPQRSIARDLPQSKTLELENRIARLELVVNDLRAINHEQQRHIAALRAQLDHLVARLTGS